MWFRVTKELNMWTKIFSLRRSLTVSIVLLIASPAAFSATPTGKITQLPSQSEITSDFAITFSDSAIRTAFKPSFSSLIEYGDSTEYTAVIPSCNEDAISPCLDKIEFSKDRGVTWSRDSGSISYLAKNFSKNTTLPPGSYSPVTKNWSADPSKYLPAGSDIRVFTLPGAKHAGGDQYLVQTTIRGTSATTSDAAKAGFLDITIFPIKVYSAPAPNSCSIWLDYCFDVFHFPIDIKIRATLDLKYLAGNFSGWFQTRMFESVVNQPSKTSYSFEGFPVVVSNARANFTKPFSEELLTQFKELRTGLIFGQPYKGTSMDSNAPNTLRDWLKYEKALDSKALYDSTIWHVVSYSTTIQKNIYQGMNGCLTNKLGVLGFVSTNATVYEVSAPSWDNSSKSLSFKVASPSFDAQGDKNSGVYELSIKQDVAKCLWGETLSGAYAVIEVVDNFGKSQVATTSFSKKGDWIYFRAYGFHYSSPSIKVKLIEGSEPDTSASPVAAAKNQSVSVKLSITCVKGKLVKKVVSFKPKCPTGYKKK